jgi:hypothetical protein
MAEVHSLLFMVAALLASCLADVPVDATHYVCSSPYWCQWNYNATPNLSLTKCSTFLGICTNTPTSSTTISVAGTFTVQNVSVYIASVTYKSSSAFRSAHTPHSTSRSSGRS